MDEVHPSTQAGVIFSLQSPGDMPLIKFRFSSANPNLRKRSFSPDPSDLHFSKAFGEKKVGPLRERNEGPTLSFTPPDPRGCRFPKYLTALREWGLGVQDSKVAEKVLSQRPKIISNSEDTCRRGAKGELPAYTMVKTWEGDGGKGVKVK